MNQTTTTTERRELVRLASAVGVLDPQNEVAVKALSLELGRAALLAAHQMRVSFEAEKRAKAALEEAEAKAWVAARHDANTKNEKPTAGDMEAHVQIAVRDWGEEHANLVDGHLVAAAGYEGARAADRTLRALIELVRSLLASARELPRVGVDDHGRPQ